MDRLSTHITVKCEMNSLLRIIQLVKVLKEVLNEGSRSRDEGGNLNNRVGVQLKEKEVNTHSTYDCGNWGKTHRWKLAESSSKLMLSSRQ